MLKRLALGLLTGWAAYGFLYEMNAAVASWDDRSRGIGRWAWRLGAPEPSRLARCLNRARKVMPPGSAVAFTSPDQPPGMEFQRWRWAAYLLPAYDVLPLGDPAAPALAEYAIAWQSKIDHPRAEPLRHLPGCWLYRVKRP